MPKVDLREAAAEREDDAGTFCASCTASAEEGSRYCMPCGMYWQDVAEGLWDDLDDLGGIGSEYLQAAYAKEDGNG